MFSGEKNLNIFFIIFDKKFCVFLYFFILVIVFFWFFLFGKWQWKGEGTGVLTELSSQDKTKKGTNMK